MTEERSAGHHVADPFGEQTSNAFRRDVTLLGGRFEFQSNSRELIELVDAAYAGLPQHRLSKDAPRLDIQLRLVENESYVGLAEPPEPRMQGGSGLLCAVCDAANLSIVCPATRRGLVAISRGLLRFPYHARYELLEFAVFTLASRAQSLVPLHAGCVGLGGRGLLLLGDSGAGKSTVALQCMLQGLDFLTEDASFVDPQRLLATGVANFLHLRGDSLPFIGDAVLTQRATDSAVIRRRSGIEKFELDLRQTGRRLAPAPLQLVGAVFISKESAAGPELLAPLGAAQLLARLTASQPYAAGLPSWQPFAQNLPQLKAFELRRGPHPRDGARALHRVLQTGAIPP